MNGSLTTSCTSNRPGHEGRLRHEHPALRLLLEGTTVPLSDGGGSGLVSLVLSDPIASELRRKLVDKFGVPHEEADVVVNQLKAHAEIVPAHGRSGWVVPDPDDDKFIDAALTAGATIIVSGDRHLLDLGSVEGVEIVTARQFLDRLPVLTEERDSATH